MRISDWSSDVCSSDLRTIYLPAISGSNETTGVDCQRYGFRLCYFAYTACKAIAPVLAKSLGKARKAIYLVPDYTYGHTTYDSMVEFTEKGAGRPSASCYTPWARQNTATSESIFHTEAPI